MYMLEPTLAEAIALLQAGDGPDSRRALARHFATCRTRGQVYRAGAHVKLVNGDRGTALKEFEAACEAAPEDAACFNDFGHLCHHVGDCDQALQALRRAASLSPESAVPAVNMVRLFHHLGLAREATRILAGVSDAAAECEGPAAAAYLREWRLRTALITRDRREADRIAEHLAARAPGDSVACWLLGLYHKRFGTIEVAEAHLLRAIEGNIDGAFTALGELYLFQGRQTEATRLIETAKARRPESSEVWWLSAVARLFDDDPDGAAAAADLACALASPLDHVVERHAWFVSLTAGARPIPPAFDHRPAAPGRRSGSFATRMERGRLWLGQPDASGTILVPSDSGFGDTIQFARFLPRLVERGLEPVIPISTSPAMAALLRRIDGVTSARETPLTDWQVPINSLPRALGLDGEPQRSPPPYLQGDPEQTATWRDIVSRDGKLAVGLAWSASLKTGGVGGRARCVPWREVAALAELPGMSFHGLQKFDGEPSPELAIDPALWQGPASFVDHADRLDDFLATASLIDALDVVVTPDSVIMHLAGALAKPVICMQAGMPMFWWRGGRYRDWYPSLSVVRKSRKGSWVAVVAEVAELLTAMRDGSSV